MTKQEFPSTLRTAYAFANPVLVVKPTSLRDRFMDVIVVLLVKMMLFMVIVMLAMQGEVMVVLMVFVLVEICLQGGGYLTNLKIHPVFAVPICLKKPVMFVK